MTVIDTFDFIIPKTNNTTLLWEEAAKESIPPQSVEKKIDDAMFCWMRELTRALRLWTDKGSEMTQGELILARVNIGSIVESWLKFFYCVYNDDYQQNPRTNRKGDVIEPNNLTFEQLKQYSANILYQPGDSWEVWIDGVQRKRNAIHAFNFRDIGTATDFYDDVEKLNEFINLITDRLPPVEECIQVYPKGYENLYLGELRVPVGRV